VAKKNGNRIFVFVPMVVAWMPDPSDKALLNLRGGKYTVVIYRSKFSRMAPVPKSPLSLTELAQACRFGRVDDVSQPLAQSTGLSNLDAALPWSGWPIGAVTEIMPSSEGIGEFRLMLPALAACTREQRHVAFIAPPYLPYPPGLVQQGLALNRVVLIQASMTSPATLLWAAEQCLRCPAFGAVLLWPSSINDKELRRLQLAAEAGKNLAVVYRPFSVASSSSPAALRLCLSVPHPMKTSSIAEQVLRIEIKKCRGGRSGAIVNCSLGTDDTPLHRVA
jgi:hypothetical protein